MVTQIGNFLMMMTMKSMKLSSRLMNTKLDVTLDELTIISCALNDYYFSQI